MQTPVSRIKTHEDRRNSWHRTAPRWLGVAVEIVAAGFLIVFLHGGALVDVHSLFANLNPIEGNLFLQLPASADGSQGAVRSALTDVEVFAPARSRVLLYVNEIPFQSFDMSQGGAETVPSVPIRYGPNIIVGRLAPPDGGDLFQLNVSGGELPPPAQPVLLARSSDASGDFLYGLANPAWPLATCFQSRKVFKHPDVLGGFIQQVDPGKPAELLSEEPTPEAAVADAPDRPCRAADGFKSYDVAMTTGATVTTREPVFRRSLSLEVGQSSTLVDARVRLPAGTIVARWAEERKLGAIEFVRYFLGLDMVGLDPRDLFGPDYTEPVNDRLLVQRLDSATDEISARFTVSASRFMINGPDPVQFPKLMSLVGDDLTLVTPVSAPIAYDLPPAEESKASGGAMRKLHWSRPFMAPQTLSVEIGPKGESSNTDSARQKASAQAAQRSPLGAVDVLRGILPKKVSTVGFWALLALPLIWFLYLLRKYAPDGSPEAVRGVRIYVMGLLVLELSFMAYLLIDLHFVGKLTRLLAELNGVSTGALPSGILPNSFPPLFVSAILIFVLLEPITARPSPMSAHVSWGWRATRWLLLWPLTLIAACAAVAAPVLMPNIPMLSGVITQVPQGLVAASQALLVGWLPVYWLLRTAFRRPIPLRIAFFASWLLLVPLLPELLQFAVNALRGFVLEQGYSPYLLPQHLDSLLWLVLIAAGGSVLLRTLLIRTLDVVRPGRAPATPSSRLPGWIAAVLILAALPIHSKLDRTIDLTALENFFYDIAYLAPVFLPLAVAAFLSLVNPQGAFALKPQEIAAGGILFGFFLCGSTTNLLLVPIPLLLGFFLFTRQLIRPPAAVLESTPASPDRQVVLGQLIALKEAQRLARLYQDTAEKKYAEGSLSRDDYEKGVAIAEDRVNAARKALVIDEGEARRRTFSLGPGSGAADNAQRAMLYGVPLTIIFLLPQFDEAFRRSGGTFPIIESLSPLMLAAAHWLVAAFLFGYFYHDIRGRDAVAKGAAFAVALVLPALVAATLNDLPILGQATGENILRAVLFVFYLAIAFDLRTLTGAGFELRDLILIYGGIPTIAYASWLATLAGVSLEPIAKGTGCWLLHFFGVNVCTGGGGG